MPQYYTRGRFGLDIASFVKKEVGTVGRDVTAYMYSSNVPRRDWSATAETAMNFKTRD